MFGPKFPLLLLIGQIRTKIGLLGLCGIISPNGICIDLRYQFCKLDVLEYALNFGDSRRIRQVHFFDPMTLYSVFDDILTSLTLDIKQNGLRDEGFGFR
jgi:hypothetical protein